MRNNLHKASLSLFLSILFSLNLFSEHHEEEAVTSSLSRGYSFTIKPGAEADFNKAFAEHTQWRRDNGDPWNWEVYVVVNGPLAGNWAVRSFGHKWADFDLYDSSEFTAKANEHWNSHVTKHLSSWDTSIIELKDELSKWNDERDYQYFIVQESRLKIGKQWHHLNALEGIGKVLKEEEWEGDWLVHVERNGGIGEAVSLVFPFENWAGMENPNPDAYAVILEAVGEEATQKMFDEFNDSIAEVSTNVFKRVPDLSIKAAE